MRQSETIAKLADALAKAQAEMHNPSKNSENPHFRNKYADLSEVVNVTRPALAKHGLSVAQFPGFSDGVVTVETMLMHASGEWLAGTVSAPAQKQDPQGIGSAVTYLRRYSLAALCGVAQEDDDGDAARASGGQRQQARPAARKEAAPAAMTDEQAQKIDELLEASTLTEEDRAAAVAFLGQAATKERASKLIDRLLRKINTPMEATA